MTIGHSFSAPASALLSRLAYLPVGALMCGAVLVLSMTPLTEAFLPRLMLFYLGTSLAYGLMPYVRRGDIPLVAAWVILFSEVPHSVSGQMISVSKVAADVLGVLMAVGPIYLARLRQVLQGDVRATVSGRRPAERAAH